MHGGLYGLCKRITIKVGLRYTLMCIVLHGIPYFLKTQNMTNLTIVSPVKMEYG